MLAIGNDIGGHICSSMLYVFTVAAPLIIISSAYAGFHRVVMYIPDTQHQILLRLYDPARVTVLEQVTASFVSFVEIHCIQAQQIMHERRYLIMAFCLIIIKQKVDMIGHQAECYHVYMIP